MPSIELAAEPPVDAQDIGDSIATVPPRRRRPLTRKLGVGLLASLGILWAVVHLAPQRPKAPLGNIRSVADHPDVDPAARAAWVRARFYLHRRTASDLDSCLREAELAIRIDPRFASGYAVKGACLFTSTYLATLSPVAAFSQAEDAASHALVLDPAHAGAHVVLAWVRAARDWDWNGAERYFRRAIELNPGFDYAHMDYGRFLSWLGRHDEALAEVRAAERISPTVPLVSHDMALALYLARRFDEAIAQAQHTIGLDSTYFLGHQRLAFGYASKGRYAEAIAAMEKAVALAPGYVRQQGFLGYVYARGG